MTVAASAALGCICVGLRLSPTAACRRRERDRERRLDERDRHGVKKSKLTRDADRDISEKIALGQANVRASGEAMYDQRLFNQDAGMASGLATDDQYNTYDKPLFADRAAVGNYRPTSGAGDDDEEGVRSFKPDKVRTELDGQACK